MALTVADGFPYYISLTGTTVNNLIYDNSCSNLFASVTPEQAAYRYAADKWSIKQIIGHITDHERIMTYRILRFSRKDPTPLPGYDENLFVENSRFHEMDFQTLLDDYKNVRCASISLINSLSSEQLALKGTAWKFEMSVDEFIKATFGHEIHHKNIINERYLK
jgi:uncharacterized damage-inducible protein DinB